MIYAYKLGSKSAKELKNALQTKMIAHKNSKFVGDKNKCILNWGASSVPYEVNKCTIINLPGYVEIASNKLKFFNHVKGKVRIPDFTDNEVVALSWLNEGEIVFGREKLTGNSGEGIVIFDNPETFKSHLNSFGNLPLYVKYVPKKEEYRVHIVNGKIIDVRRKALKKQYVNGNVNWKIRNLANGFIFAKENFKTPKDVEDQALKAINATGLDFGAVDVIWNNFYEKAYVLEINTAPGLEGSTINNYVEAFLEMFKEKEKHKIKFNPYFYKILEQDYQDIDGFDLLEEENVDNDF